MVDLLEELEDPENVLATLGESDVLGLERGWANGLLTTTDPNNRIPSEFGEES
jgi:hypothetical protein